MILLGLIFILLMLGLEYITGSLIFISIAIGSMFGLLLTLLLPLWLCISATTLVSFIAWKLLCAKFARPLTTYNSNYLLGKGGKAYSTISHHHGHVEIDREIFPARSWDQIVPKGQSIVVVEADSLPVWVVSIKDMELQGTA